MASPFFGAKSIPMRVRMAITVAISVVIVPLLPPAPNLDLLSPPAYFITLHQVLVGVAMGFSLRLVFAAVELGGQILGQLMGLGFASLMDPQNGVQVPVVSQFYAMLLTLVYLGLDGHLIAIQVLVDSFRLIPLGSQGLPMDAWWDLAVFGGQMLRGALLMALPAMAALLLLNVTFAVIVRAAPQLNLFAIGFPITLGLGLLVMIYTLPGFVPQIELLLDGALALAKGLPLVGHGR